MTRRKAKKLVKGQKVWDKEWKQTLMFDHISAFDDLGFGPLKLYLYDATGRKFHLYSKTVELVEARQ